jgi:uncharacterized protein (DUF736 family)
MTTIGAGWKKTDKNNSPYISWEIDEALFPLTIDKGKRLAAFPVKEKKSENSPDFRLDLYIPKDKDGAVQTEEVFF